MVRGLSGWPHSSLELSLESVRCPLSRVLLPPRFLCGGRRCRRRMRGAFTRQKRSCVAGPKAARRQESRTNNVLVKRPLIRLRHLLPQLKSAGGEGLSIGGTAENEPLAQRHIIPSFATNRVPAIEPGANGPSPKATERWRLAGWPDGFRRRTPASSHPVIASAARRRRASRRDASAPSHESVNDRSSLGSPPAFHPSGDWRLLRRVVPSSDPTAIPCDRRF